MFQVSEKIKASRNSLNSWSKQHFGSVRASIEVKTKQLQEAEAAAPVAQNVPNITSLRQELHNLHTKEEKMWKQRSRNQWLQNGDRNTRFFHCQATCRQRRNLIQGINDDSGVWQENEDKVASTIVSYYQSLFTSSHPMELEEVLDGVTRVVNNEMNDQLLQEFTAGEVLANRLKKVLPHVISETQSAFVPGRLISDNILIAFKTLHYMHQMRQGQQGYMALKLDMSKAYDRVEWVFLEKIMMTMGFHQKWVALMMECVQSVSFSVLINGEPKGYFNPSRGLRQGDPLSPYLFLLCAEGLHALLTRATISRHLQGIAISRGGPKLTHLFFADDSVLFCRATLMECNTILEILRKYERASGQQINQDKTTLFFSASTTAETQEEIKNALQLPVIKQYETYLGLPSMVGRSKYASFTLLKERMWRKVQGWKEKLLTQAGKEVLIKAILQAIPTYTMHCFKLPKKLCSELEGIIRNFWWGHKGESRKVHWLKWSSLCRSKCLGGMGFRDLMQFNEALLAKQVWRLLHNRESLMYKVFKAKFFSNGTIMDARHSARASYAWKSILNARHVITKGSRWRIGNGCSTKIWSDKWLPPPSSGKPLTPPCSLPHDAFVSNLILDAGIWNKPLIDQIFCPGDAQLIMGLVLSTRRVDDKLIWSREKNGTYSVRSAYRLLCEHTFATDPGCSDTGVWRQFWKRVWSLRVPHKVQQFLWRASTDSLPTMANMRRRNIVPTAYCPFCQLADEDVRHALWSCPVLTSVWASNALATKLFRRHHGTFLDILSDLFVMGTIQSIAVLAFMLWLLWNRRNKALYRNEVESLDSIPTLALRLSSEYLSAQELPECPTTTKSRTKWKPPTASAFKVNFDAALFKDQQWTGVGVIIRDGQGLPLATLSKRFPYLYSIDDAEALAAREALQFAVEIGISNTIVEFEGDSLTISNALKYQDSSFASYGDIIDEARLIARSFHGVSFSHVKREGNCAAHMLARRAIDYRMIS
uniref:Reverse transcriptase domain-containing protein n=1 Tax=Fagus sylvatica TaxID=28930 RepID=A0A2N9F4S2_FAGSY